MTILILLFICHWLADYTHLSRPAMLRAKRIGSPILPILAHGCMHGILMSVIILFYFGIEYSIYAFFVQSISHTIIDITKGKLNVWFPSLASPTNIYHWYIFGLDQLLHTVIILFIYFSII